MLLASIITLTAAFARWPGVSGTGVIVYFPLNDLVLIPLIIWDRRTLGRMHPATRWASGWLPLSQPPRIIRDARVALDRSLANRPHLAITHAVFRNPRVTAWKRQY